MQGSRFRDSGIWFKVRGLGFRFQGTVFRVRVPGSAFRV